MAERMPPPNMSGKSGKTPGVVIAVGVPKKDGVGEGRMPPPGSPSQSGPHGSKVTPDEAAVVREDQHCIDCQMYHPDTGECDKVEGQFDPQAGCANYFTPLVEEQNESTEQEQAEQTSGES